MPLMSYVCMFLLKNIDMALSGHKYEQNKTTKDAHTSTQLCINMQAAL